MMQYSLVVLLYVQHLRITPCPARPRRAPAQKHIIIPVPSL